MRSGDEAHQCNATRAGLLRIPCGANAIFFQTFNCQSIDGKKYLRKDLSIDCSDPAHQFASILAVFMVAIFSVGLPMLYLSLLILIPHRKGFVDHSGRSQARLEDVRDLRFFFMVRLKEHPF
jgi:hypothetical protein